MFWMMCLIGSTVAATVTLSRRTVLALQSYGLLHQVCFVVCVAIV